MSPGPALDGSTMSSARFRRAVDEGDLPAETDLALLLRCVMTIGNGVVVQQATRAWQLPLPGPGG
ncbi:hypothetical protein [Micromonospora endophytica]|uniref:Uncharacterized protein n=1 Tax=Micromonospora endophytica TaxID=515350 RepID=A0A2W2DN51_9ACTN|nr:hypothetical protein [Micromonospora endophytica]PZG01188.1 hypothetical protein C1I93_00275 [Micromonospora endophytica]RIW45871.1 hypothetical protein D3H59_14305 [Micromonospora endophytica]